MKAVTLPALPSFLSDRSDCQLPEGSAGDGTSRPEEGSPIGNASFGTQELASLDLHPTHMARRFSPEPVLSEKRFSHRKPTSIRGCKTLHQLANVAAADCRLHLNLRQHTSSCLLNGKLLVASDDFAWMVDLLHSQLVSVSVATRVDISVIAVAPRNQAEQRARHDVDIAGRRSGSHGRGKASENSKDKQEVPDVLAWVFHCPSQDVRGVTSLFSEKGCYLSGLAEHYRVDLSKVRGAGAFGSVVLGFPADSEDAVAVKLLKQQATAAAVASEVEMLVHAQGHPNIVSLRACCHEQSKSGNPRWAIIFDYYPSGDLHEHVSSHPCMMEDEPAMRWMGELSAALSHLRDKGIFHRDVKPENLLLTNDSLLVLTDFGIACHVSNTDEMKKSKGSLGYASPEVLMGEATGCQGDAFAAGVVLYFILSKSTPFHGPSHSDTWHQTLDCSINLNYRCFQQRSEACRRLIKGLIVRDPFARMTPQQALSIAATSEMG
eukprot:TRINITY_DN8661_c0_g1_i3.p1 TRINITY_DN8661_c0_g1~~TRINITY_DN8661_c0_g1_i3.p1  ORF type:complete len:491 (+),score=82.92 TRINITY_DN8661_c0_g1_i3:49-1521(+)